MQREGQARQGCLSVCAQGLCKDAKPTKHTQTLTLRKVGGIVRMLNKQSVYKASVVVRSEAMDVLLKRLWGWRGRWAIPQSCDR